MNILKLYWKNFKSSYNDYKYYVLSGIVGLVGLLMLDSILSLVNHIRMNQRLVNFREYYDFIKSMKTIYIFLSLGLLLYNFKNYTDKRFEDYSILTILGARQSILENLIVLEIITIYFISIVIGSLIAVGFLSILVLFTNFDISIRKVLNSSNIILIYILYFITFIPCIAYSIWLINCKNSFQLLKRSKSVNKQKSISWMGGIVGLIMIFSSVLALMAFYNKEGVAQYNIFLVFGSIFFFGLGTYLLVFNFKAISDRFMPDNEEEKYKRFLKYNSFFYRTNKYSLIIFIYFISTIIIFLFGAIEVFQYSQKTSIGYYNNMYPLDVILISPYEDKVNKILKDESIEYKTLKVKLIDWRRPDNYSTSEFEFMGFLTTINDFSVFTGREYHVRKGEIYFSEQIFEDKRHPSLDGYTEIQISDNRGEPIAYRIFNRERKYILGNFDNYLGNAFISVDSSTFSKTHGPIIYIGGFRIPDHLDLKGKENLMLDVKEKAIRNDIEFYGIEELIEYQKNISFFRILSLVIIAMIMTGIKYLIVYINAMSDFKYMRKKYFILEVCGLNNKEFISLFKSEYYLSFTIPIVLSLILTEILLILVAQDHKDISILIKMNYVICFLILLDYLYYRMLVFTVIKKFRGGESIG